MTEAWTIANREFSERQDLDYEDIAKRVLFSAVEKSAQGLLLFDYFGLPSSGTVSVCTGTIVAVYQNLSDHIEANCADLRVLVPDTTTYELVADLPKVGLSHERDLEREFNELVREWRRDTSHLSRIDRKIAHPAYRSIVAMGEPAVPLILKELEKNGGYWFAALSEITHHNPIAPDRHCNIKELSSAWIAWGRKNARSS